MNQMELKKVQESQGAEFYDLNVLSFERDGEALEAIDNGVAICDRSHWGLLKITGEDRLRYLHNQSTNDFEKRSPGESCDTVFVTSTARTLDLATAYITEESVILLVSPNRRQQLLTWLDRFIFPFDKVELSDLSASMAVFSLMGEKSSALLLELASESIPANLQQHQLVDLAGVRVRVAVGSGLATPGYTLILDNDGAAKVWSKLTELGAVPFGDRLWQNLRIQQGRPAPDLELTEDYNPLEAGLWQTISFDKGCYIGQETIARLNTYNGVKQKLWGIELDRSVVSPASITLDGTKVGLLTSCTDTASGCFGLGYVRTKYGKEGLKIMAGEAVGELRSVPFLQHRQ